MHQLDNMKYVRGDMNQTFSKELGNQCQCDGNCRCGYVQNNKLHCGNCGWNAPYSYNALTGKFVCPSCKTESCINKNKSNIDMSNYIDPSGESPYTDPSGESPFTQGVVGVGIGNDGFLLWNNRPLDSSSPITESNFDQGTVAYGIGNQGLSLNPFGNPDYANQESGFDQATVAYGIGNQGLSLDPFGNPNYSNQESGFDQATVAYGIGNQGLSLNPFGTPNYVNQETGFLGLGTKSTDDTGKSKTWIYIVVGVVALILIIAVVLMLKSKKAA